MNAFMKVADDLALDNLHTNAGGPFGAVIVKDNQIIGKGSNHVLKDNDPTAHAEVTAIRDACRFLNTYDLSGCVLYTTCFPCPMCISAIIWANIQNVYYGNTREDADNIGFKDDIIYNNINSLLNNTSSLLQLNQIDRNETIKTFQKFAEKEDKTIY